MTRLASLTQAHRDHLRGLKAEFDTACAAVPDFADRTSPAFLTARDLYRTWIKAIDAAALTLLDDLDALDGTGRDPASSRPHGVYSPVEAVRPGEVDHVFAEIDDNLQALAIVDAPEDRDVDLFGT